MNNKLVYRFTSRLNSFLSALSLSDAFSAADAEALKAGALSVSNAIIKAIDDGWDLNYTSSRMLRHAAAAANAAETRDELLFWRGRMCFLSSLGNVYKQYRAKSVMSFYDSVLAELADELRQAEFFRFSAVKPQLRTEPDGYYSTY